jgi:hypothetical protein
MSRKSLARLMVAAALSLPCGAAFAASSSPADLSPDALSLNTPAPTAVPKMLADAAAPRRISADAGVTFASDYISRGIQLENQGLIAQPYGNLYFTAYEGAGAVSKFTLFGGVWSSLHSEHTGATPDSFVESWYEFDWDAGVAIDIGKFNLNVMYIEFISPNGAFGTAHNLQVKLSYNDSDSPFPVSPYAIAFFELDGKAGTGSDEGIYIELGVAPGFALGGGDNAPRLTFPIYVGLGVSDFYQDADGDDQLFGYAAGGVVLSTPLAFMNDAGYGTWTLSVGGYFYYFGDGVRDANEAVGTDTDWDVVGNVSLGVAF